MAEQDLQQPVVADDVFAPVATRLRHARERLGLSRADVAARTKIAERHLAAIEDERFADLASSTYVVGFSRAYARAVGLDEREIAQAVRGKLDLLEEEEAPPAPAFEPGDPARVPTSRTAWLAGLGAAAAIAGLVLVLGWGSYFSPAVSLPDLAAAPPAPVPPRAAVEAQGVIPAPRAGVPVVDQAPAQSLDQATVQSAGQPAARPTGRIGARSAVPVAPSPAADQRPARGAGERAGAARAAPAQPGHSAAPAPPPAEPAAAEAAVPPPAPAPAAAPAIGGQPKASTVLE